MKRPGAAPRDTATVGRASLLLPLIAALLLVSTAAPAAARGPMALGISSTAEAKYGDSTFVEVSEAVGQPRLWTLWSQWGSRGGLKGCPVGGPGTCRFPSAAVDALPPDVIPVIWWEPVDPQNWEKGRYERYRRILNKAHDNYIRNWARDARDSGRDRIIVRFAHEMNGHWFPWGIGRFDNTRANFIKAWRHVWRIFRDEGALAPQPGARNRTGNVEFLWSVTKQRCPKCNPFKSVYPGDKFVHWVGVTAFNWGAQKSWKSMVQILQGPIRDLMAFTKKKIIVAEMASHFRIGNKARWIRNGYQRVYERWPRVKAIMYLDSRQPNIENGHPDWRLVRPKDPSAIEAYKDIAARPQFQGNLPKP
jgi:hypothetical protein